MERNYTVRDYDNQMIFIADMKTKLDGLNHKVERTNLFFSERTEIEKEIRTVGKLVSLAIQKLDEIIEPLSLDYFTDILKAPRHE